MWWGCVQKALFPFKLDLVLLKGGCCKVVGAFKLAVNIGENQKRSYRTSSS